MGRTVDGSVGSEEDRLDMESDCLVYYIIRILSSSITVP